MDFFNFETTSYPNPERVVGVDEVGRGPLAGPVVAGAVILDPSYPIEGLQDSKRLSSNRREILAAEIRERSFAWSLGRAEVEEIDNLNILRASLLAMRRAILSLRVPVKLAYIDGNIAPSLPCETVTVVGGDAKIPVISAASIIAKVSRDEEMRLEAVRYPEYGFDRNKGYATAFHLDALKKYGPTTIHRKSFAPVADNTLPQQLELT